MNASTDFGEAFQRLACARRAEETVRLGGVAGGGEGRRDGHGHTSEIVLVWSGGFKVEFKDHTLELGSGQCCVVPAGAEHRGVSRDGRPSGGTLWRMGPVR